MITSGARIQMMSSEPKLIDQNVGISSSKAHDDMVDVRLAFMNTCKRIKRHPFR